MNNIENKTPIGKEVIFNSIKDINPNAPTLNYLGNVPVMTEKIPDSSSELKEYETIREEAQYVPERDDRMGFKLISAIVKEILYA